MREFLRSVVLVFSFGVFGFGAALLNFIVFPIAKLLYKPDDYKKFSANIIHRSWKFFVGYLTFVKLIRVNVKNPEKFKNIQGKIIVATHPSFIDIVVLISLIPMSMCFVKKALGKNFILKNIVNSIFIPNDVPLDEFKAETLDYLKKDFNVIIFPTGVRHRKNEFPKIQKGASLIAVNSNVDIVPVKIYTSEDFLFVNQPFYKAGKKTVVFEVEVLPEIKTANFYDPSDIVMKRNITKEIEKVLYN